MKLDQLVGELREIKCFVEVIFGIKIECDDVFVVTGREIVTTTDASGCGEPGAKVLGAVQGRSIGVREVGVLKFHLFCEVAVRHIEGGGLSHSRFALHRK